MSSSPFPGMDPYLEQSWRDVHHSLCTYAKDDIQSQLGGGLVARVDERLVVEQSSKLRSVYGDVQVIERGKFRGPARTSTPSGIALAEPITIQIPDETPSEGFIEIIDARSGGRVITVIEFLSMTKKLPGPGRDMYQKKRRELFEGGVSLVEINLLRSGPFLGPFSESMLEPENQTPYYAIANCVWTGQVYQHYRMPLEQRLPVIGIPLREADGLVALDIQSLIDRVYRNGAYEQEIDYSKSPVPALDAATAAWADQLLKQAGLR